LFARISTPVLTASGRYAFAIVSCILRLFFSITDEQHPNHSFIKLSNPADYIASKIPHMIAICIHDLHSIVGVIGLIIMQCAMVSFAASL